MVRQKASSKMLCQSKDTLDPHLGTKTDKNDRWETQDILTTLLKLVVGKGVTEGMRHGGIFRATQRPKPSGEWLTWESWASTDLLHPETETVRSNSLRTCGKFASSHHAAKETLMQTPKTSQKVPAVLQRHLYLAMLGPATSVTTEGGSEANYLCIRWKKEREQEGKRQENGHTPSHVVTS